MAIPVAARPTTRAVAGPTPRTDRTAAGAGRLRLEPVHLRLGECASKLLAVILPFERHVQWAQTRQISGKVAENLLGGAEALPSALIARKVELPGPVGQQYRVVHLGFTSTTLGHR